MKITVIQKEKESNKNIPSTYCLFPVAHVHVYVIAKHHDNIIAFSQIADVLSLFSFCFRRSGNDLILRMNLELVEALCGFQKVIRTLDDRDLVITVIPGNVSSCI